MSVPEPVVTKSKGKKSPKNKNIKSSKTLSNVKTFKPVLSSSGTSRMHEPCTSGEDSKGDAILAYVQKLSPVKRNKKNTMDYSALVLQTEHKKLDALLYSNNKRQFLVDNEQSHTPLKIQKFTKSAVGDKVIINDMTKLSSPDLTECTFQFDKIANPGDQIVPIQEILNNRELSDRVALRGKAIHVGETNVVGAKKLNLAEAIFADKTGKIHLVD